jgi:hypothetical protein
MKYFYSMVILLVCGSGVSANDPLKHEPAHSVASRQIVKFNAGKGSGRYFGREKMLNRSSRVPVKRNTLRSSKRRS